MTGEQFVKLCYEEKKTILAEYFNPNSSSVVGKKISAITEQGISKDDLYDLLNLVLKENYYTLLLGLDGEASLGNTQITYKLYDENGNLLNECGELEAAASMTEWTAHRATMILPRCGISLTNGW